MRPIVIATCLLLAAPCAIAAPVTFDCSYTSHSDDEGLHRDEKPFDRKFIVDASAKKAYIVGNQGSSEVNVITGWDGLTFIEVTDSGNVMMTTVVTMTPEPTERLTSTHSRHTVVNGLGEAIPSQYYGSCKQQV